MITTRMRIGAAGICACLLLFGLSSCTSNREEPLPQGPQTMTGVLMPVPLSLSRRGSHLLSRDDRDLYLVEGGQTDLRDFEGVDVVISGLIERNIDPEALPVLVASGVTLVEMPARTWTVEPLSLTLETPPDWTGETFDDGIQFTQTGSTQVILKVHPSSLARLPNGVMLQMAGRAAVRVAASSGLRTVYVQNGRGIITFSYVPAAGTPAGEAERDFNRVLRSVRFGIAAPVPSSAGTGAGVSSTGSDASQTPGMPCGGPAGIICPSGEYCEITDPVDGIGRCKALKR